MLNLIKGLLLIIFMVSMISAQTEHAKYNERVILEETKLWIE